MEGQGSPEQGRAERPQFTVCQRGSGVNSYEKENTYVLTCSAFCVLDPFIQ